MCVVQTDVAELVALRAFQAQFAASIPPVDPNTPVPWCGDWTVQVLN